jgi:hypothetical protein
VRFSDLLIQADKHYSEFHTPGGRWQRENLPIEVKFSRRVVEDADPDGVRFYM